jgi:hypothetical protein
MPAAVHWAAWLAAVSVDACCHDGVTAVLALHDADEVRPGHWKVSSAAVNHAVAIMVLWGSLLDRNGAPGSKQHHAVYWVLYAAWCTKQRTAWCARQQEAGDGQGCTC